MFTIISSIIYLWIISLYLHHFLNARQLSVSTKGIIWVVYYFIHYYILNSFDNIILNFIIGYMLLLILSIILYTGDLRRFIFVTFIIYILGMLIEAGVAISIQSFGYSFEETTFSGSIISKLILLAIIHALTILKFQKNEEQPSTFYWFILFFSTMVSVLMVYIIFLFTETTKSSKLRALSALCMLALLFLNIALFVIYNKLSLSADLHAQTIAMKHQLEYYDNLIENKKNQQLLFQKERHNIKNQLIALRTYAANNQNSEIISFITKLLSKEEYGLTPFSYCDNILVDALLSSKSKLAAAHNINYILDISIPAVLPFDDVDLCILLGNALDNAFDANINLPTESDNCFVNVTLRCKNSVLYGNVSNSFYHKLQHSSPAMFNSTKSNTQLHGYGLTSMKKIIEKYHGIIDVETHNNTFSLKFSIYTV